MQTTPAQRFSETADGYAATMAIALRPVATEVVRRAALRPGERVLDLGTGTGTAAGLARGDGRTVVGIDAAPGMLAIARDRVNGVEFHEMDFGALAFADGSFDVVTAVHALLFASDQSAVLREWLRVTTRGGRMSVSVPGPTEVTPMTLYADVYARYGINMSRAYPTVDELAAQVRDAGWVDVAADGDPSTAIVLDDDEAFRVWREIGSRARTVEFTPEQHRSLTAEMLAITPRDDTGRLRIPFGTIYVTGRRPD